MPLVLERGERGHLSQRVHVEGGANPVEERHAVRRRHAIAHAEPRQARSLGEGAQDGDLAPLPEIGQRIGEVGALGELQVRLVEDHDDAVGNPGHEILHLVGRHDRGGGIVGVGDEDHLGHGRDGACHRFEVEAVLLEGHDDADAAHGLDDHRVYHEGGVRDDDLLPGAHERPHEELDELVGPVAQDNVVGVDPMAPGECVAQVEAAAVGIAVQLAECGRDGLLDALRGRQRVLVGGELDGVLDAQLALELLDGLPRLIRGDAEDVVVGERFPGGGHGRLLMRPDRTRGS